MFNSVLRAISGDYLCNYLAELKLISNWS